MATLTGTAGNDLIHRIGDGIAVPAGWTELLGVTLLDDTLLGMAGNDILYGGAGNDLLNGGLDVDTMYGGAGNDIYIVDNALDVLSESAGGGLDQVRASVSWVLGANLENLLLTGLAAINGTGNGLNNVLTGNAAANSLAGGAGNDTLFGAAGADTLTGGAGLDAVYGGDGGDRLIITNRTHIVAGEIYSGGLGIDTLDGLAVTQAATFVGTTISGIEYLYGFSGGLTLTASQLHGINGGISTGTLRVATAGLIDLTDTVVSTDIINLSAGGNTLRLQGVYSIYGMFDGRVNGGAGADKVTVSASGYGYVPVGVTLNGYGGDDTLTSGDGADTLTGGTGNDALYGGSRADRLTGGTGRDSVFGGSGGDTIVVSTASDLQAGEIYDGGDDFDTLSGGGVTTAASLVGVSLTNIEYLTGFSGGLTLTTGQLNGFLGQILTGNLTVADAGFIDLTDVVQVSANVITLSDAGNTLTLYGGSLADGAFDGTVQGRNGNDTVRVLAAYGAVGVSLNGNGGNDSLTGGFGSDAITGGTGRDTLDGGSGDDTLTGGGWQDSISSGEGNDRLVISTASDVVAGEIYNGGLDIDTLDGTSVTTAVNLSAVTLTQIENLTGFSAGLSLTAAQLGGFIGAISTGALRVSTGGSIHLTPATVVASSITLTGATIINLPDFRSVVHGSSSADMISVFSAADNTQLVLNGNGGNDTLSAGAGEDILSGGSGNDALSGGAGNDQLLGGTGDDVLTSGSGADWLEGGAGNDTLFGAAEGDRFVFTAADFGGTDYIMGFDAALNGAPLGSFIDIQGGATAASYLGDAAFTGAGQTQVRFDGTQLQVDFDGNGSSDFRINLYGMDAASDLGQSDFL